MSHTSPTGRETADLATLQPGYRHVRHIPRSLQAGYWNLQSNLGMWQIRMNGPTSSNPKYDIYTNFHWDLICRFDVITTCSAVLQDYRNIIYPTVYGPVVLHYYSTVPIKFGSQIVSDEPYIVFDSSKSILSRCGRVSHQLRTSSKILPQIAVFAPVKNLGGSSKIKTCVSENRLCNTYAQ